MKSKAFVQIAMILALVLNAGPVFAQTIQFGDWSVSQSPSGPAAGTGNSRSSLIMYQVFDQVIGTAYTWQLEGTAVNCQDQAISSAHITTDVGSANTTVWCTHVNGSSVFVFMDFAVVAQTLRGAERVRIDIPVQNGDLYSVEFSLRGLPDAAAYLTTFEPGRNDGDISSAQCRQLWDRYDRCLDDFKKCTVMPQGTGPCTACFRPNCAE